jgi:hypothetical protein
MLTVKTDSYSVDAANTKKKDTVRTGIATGAGAIIGGIAGGGKGAAIGAWRRRSSRASGPPWPRAAPRR